MIQIDMDKPKDCIWADITNHIYYCPLLNEYHKCNLQDYEPRTIEEQYVHCPLHEADPDTVSRQAVRDAVYEELDSIDHVPQWVFDRLTKKIENLPPAQPTGTPLHDNGSDYSHGFADGYKNGLKDAKSQRKGYWRHYEGYLTCSECGDEYYADIMAYCGDNVPKFCPNCGADMREDAEERKKCDTCKHEKEPWSMQCHRCENYNLWEGKQ